jgi:hypothetical protein
MKLTLTVTRTFSWVQPDGTRQYHAIVSAKDELGRIRFQLGAHSWEDTDDAYMRNALHTFAVKKLEHKIFILKGNQAEMLIPLDA